MENYIKSHLNLHDLSRALLVHDLSCNIFLLCSNKNVTLHYTKLINRIKTCLTESLYLSLSFKYHVKSQKLKINLYDSSRALLVHDLSCNIFLLCRFKVFFVCL